MEQPNTTNPQPEQTLDDDVESLLASVRATQVEPPAERDEGDAIALGMIASDDSADVADLLNARHDVSVAEQASAANGDGTTVEGGHSGADTAAIDAQLDVLTRQAAELATMATAPSEIAPDAMGLGSVTSDGVLAGTAVHSVDDVSTGELPIDVESLLNAVASEVGGVDAAAAPAPERAAPDGAALDGAALDGAALDGAALDRAALDKAAPGGAASEGTLPTSVEDAAGLAAEMLAKANAAVEEINAPIAMMGEGRAEAPDVVPDVAAGVGDLPAEVGERPEPGESGPTATRPFEAAGADPEQTIEAPVRQTGAAAWNGTAAGDATPMESIKSLDEQIAMLSDDLLNQPSQADAMLPPDPSAAVAPDVATAARGSGLGSSAAQSATAAAPTSAASSRPSSGPDSSPVAARRPAPGATDATTATAAVASSSLVSASASAGVDSSQGVAPDAGAERIARAGAATEPEALVPVAKPSVSLRQRLAPVAKGVGKGLGGVFAIATPVLAALSAPLAKKPRIVRDSIGWIAVNTVFCASCLWGYMLFLRPAQIAEQHAAFDLAHAELPDVPGHGTDPHAAGAHGAGGHGAAKDDGHGAKKDDGHGGGHGGAAKPGAKKEAYKPPSRKPPTKAERAKAKPKDDGHGGGGH